MERREKVLKKVRRTFAAKKIQAKWAKFTKVRKNWLSDAKMEMKAVVRIQRFVKSSKNAPKKLDVPRFKAQLLGLYQGWKLRRALKNL